MCYVVYILSPNTAITRSYRAYTHTIEHAFPVLSILLHANHYVFGRARKNEPSAFPHQSNVHFTYYECTVCTTCTTCHITHMADYTCVSLAFQPTLIQVCPNLLSSLSATLDLRWVEQLQTCLTSNCMIDPHNHILLLVVQASGIPSIQYGYKPLALTQPSEYPQMKPYQDGDPWAPASHSKHTTGRRCGSCALQELETQLLISPASMSSC